MPASNQNRGIALSYYTCGPLAWAFPLALIAAPACAVLLQIWGMQPAMRTVAGLGLVVGLVGVAWWYDVIQTARRLMPQAQGRSVVIALALPAVWLAEGFLILVGLPLLLFGVLVVFVSLG